MDIREGKEKKGRRNRIGRKNKETNKMAEKSTRLSIFHLNELAAGVGKQEILERQQRKRGKIDCKL